MPPGEISKCRWSQQVVKVRVAKAVARVENLLKHQKEAAPLARYMVPFALILQHGTSSHL